MSQFGNAKMIGICRETGDWIEVESTEESCPHGNCDCGLAFFVALQSQKGLPLAHPDSPFSQMLDSDEHKK